MTPGSSETSDTTADAAPCEERGRARGSSVLEQINDLNDLEAQSRYEEETADRGLGALHHIRSRTRSRTNETVIGWEYNDPENPYNWSSGRKSMVLFQCGMLVVNSTMGSSLPSNAVNSIMREFGRSSPEERVLPISVYLIGYVLGPVTWGPLSEQYGRRYLSIATFIAFCIFTVACGFAPNWHALLVFRFLCGATGSAPIAVVAGILADVYGNPRTRGRAFAVFMATTVSGPLWAPILSGYTSETPGIGWRWTFYIAVMFAAVTLILALFLPETFGPVLLSRRARRMRKADPSSRAIAPRDLEDTDLSQLLTVVLTRPIRMLITEPIVAATCAYLALVYSIFYMCFQAFPIVFQDLYGMSRGVAGLCYLPIGGGALVSLPVFWCWDDILARATERGAAWTRREEFRRLPLACLGGPVFVISLFWLGWTSRAEISFVSPMLAGVPFGFGFMLIFMAMLNYLTDAYDFFAASANGAASACRSLMAVVLPLATARMFSDLGIAGACSLLGGLSGLMCVIPFIFIWKGVSLRARSKFCQALRERREELARKAEEQRLQLERAAEREKEDV